MNPAADYPCSPTFRRAIERGAQRYCSHHFTGGACVMCHHTPEKNRQARTVASVRPAGTVPPARAVNTAIEREVIGAALALAQDAARKLAALDALMRERPDLFRADWVASAGLSCHAFLARCRDRLKVRA